MKLRWLVPTALALAPLASAQDVTPRPNLVLFLVDDLGWQDVSVPFHSERTPFNERYRTPNLERLAQRGVKLTQAYASAPVCTPTRTSILTGRSPGQTHITYWTLYKDTDQSAAFPGLKAPAWDVNALQPEDVTLPRLLSEAGYRTIHVGKAHFGARDTPGADPRNLGFDVNIAGHAAGGPGSYLGTNEFSAAHRGGGHVWDVPGLEAWHGQDVYLTEALTVEALKAVQAAVADERPFYLHFAPYAVHAPIEANARYLEHYEELHPTEAAYATMVESVDAALGALLDELERLGVAERTVVVFTSDNGGLSAHARGGAAHTHNAPLRSGKGSAYEGGIRVPFVAALPGAPRAGETEATPVATHDLFPTFLALAEVPVPPDHASTVEGVDLGPLLRGEEALPERGLYWHQPHFWGVRGPGIWPFSAVRRGDWKLIWRHADGGFELYHLGRDLSEAVDLAPYEPARVRELASDLQGWIERVEAQVSLDARTGDPIELPRAAAARLRPVEGR
jgi:arylsulfatase A-like enzyme